MSMENQMQNMASQEKNETHDALIETLKNHFQNNTNLYSMDSNGVIHEIIKDENVVGGEYTKEVHRSNEEVNEKTHTSLNEESYDALKSAFEKTKEAGLLNSTAPYSGYTEKNTFTPQKLMGLLESK